MNEAQETVPQILHRNAEERSRIRPRPEPDGVMS
jgi:hypothetical protein